MNHSPRYSASRTITALENLFSLFCVENTMFITPVKVCKTIPSVKNFEHLSNLDFEHLNWLQVTFRFKQCANSIIFKDFNEQCPNYQNEILDVTTEINFIVERSFINLNYNVLFARLIPVNLLCLTLVQLFETMFWIHSSVLTILIRSNIL